MQAASQMKKHDLLEFLFGTGNRCDPVFKVDESEMIASATSSRSPKIHAWHAARALLCRVVPASLHGGLPDGEQPTHGPKPALRYLVNRNVGS
ncbi:hypothetical protein Y1Q_0013761 [Alligator mississippiensis]|uniref:Uncharacterized protein n=1 Tax=Alligator mississippiensis TaxID=8496 RepID=A0A151MM41_ALLMI|nr:hypothetical protein Y1Q_0013761 [Alligator mississippiensis]